MKSLVEEIVANGLCHGCGACIGVSRQNVGHMAISPEGFARPVVTERSAEHDELTNQVCSGLSLTGLAGGSDYDPSWGKIESLSAGYSTDPRVRNVASSGGVLSALLTFLLDSGEVDRVIQTSADVEDPILNRTVISRSADEVINASGSRYSPSSPLGEINDILELGLRFAFVGKPCDVAALRKIALVDPRVDRQIPYMFSFFCAGVPSQRGTLAVLKQLGVSRDDLIQFAYRGNGWPGLTRAKTRDGAEKTMTYEAAWGGILNRHLQARCKVCPDGTGEFADISCGDAWYGKNGYPDFTEADGRSLIVTRTQKGRQVLEAAIARGRVSQEPVDRADLKIIQPYQFDRKRAVAARLMGSRFAGRKAPRFKGFALLHLTARSSPRFLLKNFLGSLRRALKRS